MATVVLQHGRHLGFFKKFYFTQNLQQILLKLIENMFFQPQHRNRIKNRV